MPACVTKGMMASPAGPAGEAIIPFVTQAGIVLLWISAIITLYTGYDYFRAGLRHIDV